MAATGSRRTTSTAFSDGGEAPRVGEPKDKGETVKESADGTCSLVTNVRPTEKLQAKVDEDSGAKRIEEYEKKTTSEHAHDNWKHDKEATCELGKRLASSLTTHPATSPWSGNGRNYAAALLGAKPMAAKQARADRSLACADSVSSKDTARCLATYPPIDAQPPKQFRHGNVHNTTNGSKMPSEDRPTTSKGASTEVDRTTGTTNLPPVEVPPTDTQQFSRKSKDNGVGDDVANILMLASKATTPTVECVSADARDSISTVASDGFIQGLKEAITDSRHPDTDRASRGGEADPEEDLWSTSSRFFDFLQSSATSPQASCFSLPRVCDRPKGASDTGAALHCNRDTSTALIKVDCSHLVLPTTVSLPSLAPLIADSGLLPFGECGAGNTQSAPAPAEFSQWGRTDAPSSKWFPSVLGTPPPGFAAPTSPLYPLSLPSPPHGSNASSYSSTAAVMKALCAGGGETIRNTGDTFADLLAAFDAVEGAGEWEPSTRGCEERQGDGSLTSAGWPEKGNSNSGAWHEKLQAPAAAAPGFLDSIGHYLEAPRPGVGMFAAREAPSHHTRRASVLQNSRGNATAASGGQSIPTCAASAAHAPCFHSFSPSSPPCFSPVRNNLGTAFSQRRATAVSQVPAPGPSPSSAYRLWPAQVALDNNKPVDPRRSWRRPEMLKAVVVALIRGDEGGAAGVATVAPSPVAQNFGPKHVAYTTEAKPTTPDGLF
eukprot:GHVT01039439.1.p1 GENE.GHVT01039439.1~~GHVT01039439.1.p1  ORF type:complete len:717 (-),score=117.52 GHVT01039439.1:1662-3812(-)